MSGRLKTPAERILNQPHGGQRPQTFVGMLQKHHRTALEMLAQYLHQALQANRRR